MGMFGIAEIIANLEQKEHREVFTSKVGSADADARRTCKRMIAPILRGTALGSVLGVLPGGGALLASFAAYTLEKKVSQAPARVRQGRHRGRRRRRKRPTTPARRPRSSRC